MYEGGVAITEIAETLSVSRPTIYRVLDVKDSRK
jgi:predicted DNA-binding transcriptional regulator AlpA